VILTRSWHCLSSIFNAADHLRKGLFRVQILGSITHDLVRRLPILRLGEYQALWDKVDRTVFKPSNYRVRMEIGADPEFRGIDWEIVKGGEYLLFERVVESVKRLKQQSDAAPEQWL